MAFSKGNESTNGAVFTNIPKFVGVASVKVLAVNPKVAEYNKITGANRTEEIEYTGVKDDVKFARVSFLVEVDPERSQDKCSGVTRIDFWLRRQQVKGQNSGKIKIIDKYGQTAWATEEDIAAKRIPQYSNGPASIDADYRKCITGEEELTMFLKALMVIPDVRVFNKTKQMWEPNPKATPDQCEARLDKVMKYFDGDFSEITSILKTFPNNQARVLFGVKKSDDGRMYQDFYTGRFSVNHSSSNLAFAKKLNEDLAMGRYANTYFGEKGPEGIMTADVREYKVDTTTYTDSTASMPTANTDKFDAPLPDVGAVASQVDDDDDLPF